MASSSSTVALPCTSTSTSPAEAAAAAVKITLTLTNNNNNNATQPHTTVITTIPSTPNTVPTGSLLALTNHHHHHERSRVDSDSGDNNNANNATASNYIVYAVKNGLIRVMDATKSNLRTLLRGHPARITDTSFFGVTSTSGNSNSNSHAGSDILASVGGNECRIWRIFGNSDDASQMTEIYNEMLLEIRVKPSMGLERVVWHPFNPNQFMLLHNATTDGDDDGNSDKRNVATFVETTRLMTTAAGEDGHAVCDITNKKESESVDGMLNLIVQDTVSGNGDGDCGISDLTFSADARYVLTAHNDGCVRLWDLKAIFIPTNANANAHANTKPSAQCIMTVRVTKETGVGVKKCSFLSAHDAGGQLTHPFITCTKHGEVTLWSPFPQSRLPPSKVASFQVKSSSDHDDIIWDSSVCTLPYETFPADASNNSNPPSTFVILSNDKGAIHALHVATKWNPTNPNPNPQINPRKAIATGFDHVSFFQSLQPIYSQCVIPSLDLSSDVHVRSLWNIDVYCVQSKAVQKLTLSPSMCAAPLPLPQGVVPDGIALTVMDDDDDDDHTGGNDGIDGHDNSGDNDNGGGEKVELVQIADDGYGNPEADFADYDDYEDIDVDEDEEDDDDDDDDEVEVIDVPPPPMPGFPIPGTAGSSSAISAMSSGNSSIKSDSSPSPFANWLGNLAAVSSQKVEATSSAPVPVPVPVPVAPDIDLADLPLPEEPDIIPMESVPTPVPASVPPPEPKEQQQQELLSPMQILGLAPKKAPATKEPSPSAVKQVQLKAEKVKEKKNTSSSKSNGGGGKKSSSSLPSQPVPIPDKGGKIAILKREDAAPKKQQQQQQQAVPTVIPGDRKSPSVPATSAGVNGNVVGVTKDDVEDIVRRAVSTHFQKQEQFITAEIQKAVRYEVQSGVVPALNKTVAQTLEQTVTKSMKTTVTKTVKECMKANTSEMIKSISTKLEEPLVDGFHKSMKEIMVPAYESGTRQMFEQISSSIETGLELKEKDNGETAKLMDGMVKRMDAMGKTIEVLIKAVAQLQNGGAGAQPSAAGQRGGAAGGAMGADASRNEDELLRAKIIDLIRMKDYEKAFTAALTVSNSAMAVFVVKHSNLSEVIEGDSPVLSQPIMLCLMQQLGADLSTDEDLPIKLAWLQSIAVTLDPYSESIKRHIKGVVQQLVTNLHAKMQESDQTLRRHLQMLLQVIRGIGNA